MKVRFLVNFLAAVCFFCSVGTVWAVPPDITDSRATAEYWTAKNPQGEELLMSEGEIADFNQSIREKGLWVASASDAPAVVSGQKVRDLIRKAAGGYYEPKEFPRVYRNGHLLTKAEFDKVKAECALEKVPSLVRLRYAVTVERADLRVLPDWAGWLDGLDDVDKHYDNLQQTAVDPAEPVLVLADSAEGDLVFVQMRFCAGWVSPEKIAYTNREDWLKYLNPKDFAVVVDNKKEFCQGDHRWLFQMGSKIPLIKNKGEQSLLLPVRNEDATLKMSVMPMPREESVMVGFLPCTENNIIRQGFNFLGDVYGWGGQDESVDCSAFVQDVYRSVGVEIPRNSKVQERVFSHKTVLKDLPISERRQLLSAARPGSLLFKKGHVMLYLGMDDKNTPIFIHSASSYYRDHKKLYIRKVIVSEPGFLNEDADAYIGKLVSIGSLR